MREIQAAFPIGTVIRGRYSIECLLGKGTHSIVYLVRDQHVKNTQDQFFVLKQLIALTTQERHRLIFEVSLLRQLSHQALPHVYDVFSDERHGWVYMLMEYIEGQHLDILRHQQPERRFSWPEVMTILAPIIDAVSYLHRQHPPLIHGDIKPANIIVPRTGTRSVLVDFGIRKEYDPDATVVLRRALSSNYQAPEQSGSGSDIRTDIYGLGATFYTLLTGMVPADPVSRVTQLSNEGTDPVKPADEVVPTVPAPVAQVIQRAMAIRVQDRFSSVEQIWAALWSQGEQFSPPALKQAVTRPATISTAKLPHTPRPWKLRPLWPFTRKQTVEKPVPAPVLKQQGAQQPRKLGALWPAIRKQVVEKPVSALEAVRNWISSRR